MDRRVVTLDILRQAIVEVTQKDAALIEGHARLDQIGIDSMSLVDVLMTVERLAQSELPDDLVEKIHKSPLVTVADLLSVLS